MIMAVEYRLSYTASEIDSKLSEINNLAKKSEIPTKVSELTNDKNYATETYVQGYAQPKGDYATKSEIPEVPVQSVNGQTGEINLTASDVGALPDTTSIPSALSDLTADATHRTVTDAEKATWNAKSDFSGSYNDLTNKPTIPSIDGLATENYVNTQIAAIPTPDVSGQISTHNTNINAHNDIRDLISGLTTRLNALADSDDTTLDQMSEVVSYIKSNRTLIEEITTNKVNVSDIINNLTSNITNKPLSAAQGVALKSLIDDKADSSHTHSISDVAILQTTLDGKVPMDRTINGKALNSNVTLSASDVNAYTKTETDNKISTSVGELGELVGTLPEGTTATSVVDYINIKTAGVSTDAALAELQAQVEGKADKSHTHNYAGSSSAGGAATSAVKLDSSAGSTTQPVYFSDGKPVATTYSLNKTVPSDAVFTDTTYSTGTASTSGLTKLYTGTGTATDGTMTQNAIKTALDSKADSGHSHTITANSSDDDVIVLTGTNGTNSVSYSASHANSGVTAGTYKSVTVDAKGHVTGGSNPTTLAGYGITDAESKGAADTALSSAKTYADNSINTHNTSDAAHSDIRTLISDLTTKLNNFLDVDDTTTDQLSEVLTLIENNRGTLESLTTSKVNVSDIIDNLTTSNASKVLSAKQGVAIKSLIDALQTALDEHTHAIADVNGLQSALDGKSDSSHTHNYAGSYSAGGSATSAVKLDSSAGSATQPVYFSEGKPVATTYTLGTSVPSGAKFTDTTYSIATTTNDGLMSAEDKTKLDGIVDISKQTSLPSSGTTLIADTEYRVASEVGTYQFVFPSSGDVYVRFTTAATFSISFASGTSYLGAAPNFKASTTYEMFARDGIVAVAEVVVA